MEFGPGICVGECRKLLIAYVPIFMEPFLVLTKINKNNIIVYCKDGRADKPLRLRWEKLNVHGYNRHL